MLSTATLTEKTLALGFDLAGIAPAGPAPHGRHLREWCEKGYAGEMAYMARSVDVRADPRARFSWARSILCVAMSYPSATVYGRRLNVSGPQGGPREAGLAQRAANDDRAPALRGSPQGSYGQVSCYAWGHDYHDVLGRALVELQGFLQKQGASRTKSYVDTGPVLERDWAARAGLGWIGKNTMLINQRLGSWLFLGTVLTDMELLPNEPHPDRCGTCTDCIDACPTGALLAPYILDARRCISYLTIEFKGVLPPGLRPIVGTWVFGCDICQSVCPWNAKAQRAGTPRVAARPANGPGSSTEAAARPAVTPAPADSPALTGSTPDRAAVATPPTDGPAAAAPPAGESAFAPRPGLARLDLEWALRNPEALSELVSGTPVERAKGERLTRNIIVAAGNSGEPRLIRALEPYAANPPPDLAGHVGWALKRLRG